MKKDWKSPVLDREAGTRRLALNKISRFCAEHEVEYDREEYLGFDYQFHTMTETDLHILALWHGAFGQSAPYDPTAFTHYEFQSIEYLNKLKFYFAQGVPIDL